MYGTQITHKKNVHIGPEKRRKKGIASMTAKTNP